MGPARRSVRRPSRSGFGLLLPCIALGAGLCILLALFSNNPVYDESATFVGGAVAHRSPEVARAADINRMSESIKDQIQERTLKGKAERLQKRFKGTWREKAEMDRRKASLEKRGVDTSEGFQMPNPMDMFEKANEDESLAPPPKIALWQNEESVVRAAQTAKPASEASGGGFDFFGMFGGDAAKPAAAATTTKAPDDDGGLFGMFR